ncbi:MAG TPA: triose-phosphate isomerase [Rhabdochlamydiaceae bacterium]|nr:triose-phosphate isomerase [Rhabdochlamydiaceae bacterium]
MSRIPIIAANWKMYKTGEEAQKFFQELYQRLPEPTVMVFIAPSFTALLPCAIAAEEMSYLLGAQNMHGADEGAFTGEVSANMIREVGASFVIIGHSERRRLFHESDEIIHQKMKKAFSADLLPLLCIGETIEEREAGKTMAVLEKQLKIALGTCPPADLVIAYEPVWAIGTGKTATPAIAEEAHAFCRLLLGELWGKESAEKTPILYGGSVTPETASELAKQPNIDGALVGGASLDVEKFLKIIEGFTP